MKGTRQLIKQTDVNGLVRRAHLNNMGFNTVKCKVTHLGTKNVGNVKQNPGMQWY